MSTTIECPVPELRWDFPPHVYIMRHTPTSKYGCYCFNGVHGLACCSTVASAHAFIEIISIDLLDMEIEEVSFEVAREVAKARPPEIVSIMLVDNLEAPEIHYVR